jgi:A/G-specific adenine glycosylase
MLQQTRVDQAQPYFERFMAAFPTLQDLAEADLDNVLVAWEGLGYYSRARNLHKAAKRIAESHAGRLPDDYEALRALPGIGPYTAAAVLAIAFSQPYGVLDGNVIRVLTRLACISDEASSAKTKRVLQKLSDDLVAPDAPGAFNQAMMELGATVCTPQNPRCDVCPVLKRCGARATDKVAFFPVLKKKDPVPHYDIAVGILENETGELLIQRRPEEGLLGGLWEFPGGKRESDEPLHATCVREFREEFGVEVIIDRPVMTLSHAYSHFKITLHAFKCRIRSGIPSSRSNLSLRWVAIDALNAFAFPRANRKLIDRLIEERQAPSLFDL